jgi:endonuclease-3
MVRWDAELGGPDGTGGGIVKKAKPQRESAAQRVGRAGWLAAKLRATYPRADCALEHDSPLKLLVATILSAQCTDERVNKVTPGLFARYPTAAELAKADPRELEGLIRSTGFFRNKTRNLIGAARVISERFAGQVPDTMEGLLQLPGVARKTANVILGTWFGKNEGFVVDTHIGRLAHRLGVTWRSRDDKDAVKIEQDLMEVFPRNEWAFLGHALIEHGRKVCSARKPACERCALSDRCPSAFSFGQSTASTRDRALRRQARPSPKRRARSAASSGRLRGGARTGRGRRARA